VKREEAIMVLKELLESCVGLDGRGLELSPPNAPTSGYQIIIKGVLDGETNKHVQNIAAKHQLAIQTGNIWKTKHSPDKAVPDTLIIYKPKNSKA
jgi:hypothetical protein